MNSKYKIGQRYGEDGNIYWYAMEWVRNAWLVLRTGYDHNGKTTCRTYFTREEAIEVCRLNAMSIQWDDISEEVFSFDDNLKKIIPKES